LRRYEAMFLFDTPAARDWAAIDQEVRRLCDRIEAQVLVCLKYDERKLAFEIRRRKRGTYVLVYMDAPPERIGDLERDVQLSEVILRIIIVRAENLTEEKLAQLKAHNPEVALCPAGDGRRHDDHGYGDRRGGRWGGEPEAAGAPAHEARPVEESVVASPAGAGSGRLRPDVPGVDAAE
jgi:small subunit ribosomal protein S6